MSEGGSVSEERGVLLVVDDESTNIEVLNAVLEDGYDIIFATSGAEALERARTENPDLVLLDVVMPGMDGYEVCARLKANRHTAAIPVIFVTALDACADEARGLEAGAIDYVTKPISPPIVRARVRNHIELKRARDLLEKLSTTDGLTGLANRRHFDATLARECRSHHRGGKPLSLLLIDVDHFKIFNDTYGHVAGDACLKRVATSIAGSLERPRDLAARYGGEEFACILPETGHVGALAIAARIRTEIAGLGIVHDGSLVAQHVTASLGVATVSCINTVNPEDIVTLADAQLYRAKAAGRNRVHGVNAGDMPPAGTDSLIRGGDSRLAERQVEMEWLRRIRLALKENRFTLYFQRYQSLDSSAPDGEHREILLRMIGEDGRHIPPGELIPTVIGPLPGGSA